MSSCLLMSRTFVSDVGLFLLISASCAQDSSICSTWVSDHDAEYNQDTSIILWEKMDRPFIDCALFCTMDLSCRSFFYHPSLEKCLGSLSYKRGLPVSQSVQQGWNYYTRPQHCDGGYIYNPTLELCYKYYNIALDYWNAMNICETEGAKLVIVRNEAELEFFSSFAQAGYWVRIGLRSTMVNTVWRWWNGQTVSNLTWYLANPSSYNNETCGVIQNGTLTNQVCSLLERNFLCQKHIG